MNTLNLEWWIICNEKVAHSLLRLSRVFEMLGLLLPDGHADSLQELALHTSWHAIAKYDNPPYVKSIPQKIPKPEPSGLVYASTIARRRLQSVTDVLIKDEDKWVIKDIISCAISLIVANTIFIEDVFLECDIVSDPSIIGPEWKKEKKEYLAPKNGACLIWILIHAKLRKLKTKICPISIE